MSNLFSHLIKFVDISFGTCSICMRKAFIAGATASVIHLAIAMIWPEGPLYMLSGIAAIGLVLLWILHVASYSARAVRIVNRKRREAVSALSANRQEAHPDRRATLGVFAKAAGLAVFASATLWPFGAGANQHVCGDNSRCEIGNKCCWNSDSETYFCCASSHVCCVDGYSSYCRNPNIGESC